MNGRDARATDPSNKPCAIALLLAHTVRPQRMKKRDVSLRRRPGGEDGLLRQAYLRVTVTSAQGDHPESPDALLARTR